MQFVNLQHRQDFKLPVTPESGMTGVVIAGCYIRIAEHGQHVDERTTVG